MSLNSNVYSLGFRASLLLLVALASAGRADADIRWSWSFGSESGTFLTDGSVDGSGQAPAGTYTILEFEVTQSIIPGNIGSSANGHYVETQPTSGFVWDGTIPTEWFRAGGIYTNGTNFFRHDFAFRYLFAIGYYRLIEGDFEERVASDTIEMGVAALGWTNLGHALAGTHGEPVLAGSGTLSAGQTVTLSLSQALENSTTTLIIGLAALNAPFGGGILVPSPDLMLAGLPTSPTGTLDITASVPSDLPAGVSIFFQHWIIDPAGPAGFAASNALQGVSE